MNDISIDNAGLSLAASVVGSPEAPPVLLLHGISHSRDVWYDWAVELSDRYRVYTLDFRGHGHSNRAERPKRFALLIGLVEQLRGAKAPLAEWVATVGNTPHPFGGVFADHMSYRQIVSHASALQRQDPACWRIPMYESFATLDTTQPFRRPTRVIRCDSTLGAAFLDQHADNTRAVNPSLDVLHYVGSDHFPQRTRAFASRFREDLDAFFARVERR